MAAFFEIFTTAFGAELPGPASLRRVWRIGADGRPTCAWLARGR